MAPLSLADVRAAMLVKLRDSLLKPDHARILKFKPMTEDMARRAGIVPPWAGFQLPYWTPQGRERRDVWRYRFWPACKPAGGWRGLGKEADLKYVQPPATPPAAYMPPLLGSHKWAEVISTVDCPDLDITEGELKAAAGCVAGRLVLGLGGVYSWTSRRCQQPLIPDLEQFKWSGRRVNLIFDSDQTTKPLVQLALSRLAETLLARGARVYNVVLPPGPEGRKTGLDDYLLTHTVAQLEELINKAQETGASAELHRLNGELAVIWGGGSGGNIVRLDEGSVHSHNMITRSLFRDRVYMEFRLGAKGEPLTPRPVRAAEAWLEWPLRTTVDAITYAPGREMITPDNKYNLWKPGGLEPRKGSLAPWERLFRHVTANLTEQQRLWFRRWLAWPLRNPDACKMNSCVLVWSHQGGTGKNLLGETMVPLYGAGNCALIGSEALVGDFNGWAEGKQWIVGDEIALEDKRHISGKLKSLITAQTIRINRKGIEAYEIPHCANYYFTSNDALAMTLDPGERRTFVVRTAESALEAVERGFGERVRYWLDHEGGAAALLWHLTRELDLGDFSPRAEPPDTAAKEELILNSRSSVEDWAAALRRDPEATLVSERAKFEGGPARAVYTVYTSQELVKLCDPDERQKVSARAMGMALDKAGFRKARGNNGRLGNVRAQFWLIGTDREMTGTEAARLYQAEREATAFRRGGSGAVDGRKVQ